MGVVSATVNTVAMRKRSILPLVKWKRTWQYTHAASCLCHIVTPPTPQSNKVSASSLPVTFGKIWRFEMPGCIIYIRWKETTKPWVLVGDAFIDKLFFTLFAFFFLFLLLPLLLYINLCMTPVTRELWIVCDRYVWLQMHACVEEWLMFSKVRLSVCVQKMGGGWGVAGVCVRACQGDTKPPLDEAAMLGVTPQVTGHPLQLLW